MQQVNDTRAIVIAKNQLLTLKDAKKLAGKTIAICSKDADGNFSEFVDRVYIKDISKVKGEKRHVILDLMGGWSYHSIEGKTFTQPNFQTGEELAVYYVVLA